MRVMMGESSSVAISVLGLSEGGAANGVGSPAVGSNGLGCAGDSVSGSREGARLAPPNTSVAQDGTAGSEMPLGMATSSSDAASDVLHDVGSTSRGAHVGDGMSKVNGTTAPFCDVVVGDTSVASAGDTRGDPDGELAGLGGKQSNARAGSVSKQLTMSPSCVSATSPPSARSE